MMNENAPENLENADFLRQKLANYQKGMYTLSEILVVIFGCAATGSIESLLDHLPAELRADLAREFSEPPCHREDWLLIESVCQSPDVSEADYFAAKEQRNNATYQGYCRLHAYFKSS